MRQTECAGDDARRSRRRCDAPSGAQVTSGELLGEEARKVSRIAQQRSSWPALTAGEGGVECKPLPTRDSP
jgi:hypothetical protein